MIEFNDKERKSLGGMFDVPSEKSGGAFGRSNDIGVGVSGLESSYADKRKNDDNVKVSDRGSQMFSTIISESEEHAFDPLVDRMINSVFTVTVDNAKEDFIVPLGNILTTLKEYEEEQRFAQQFVYQGMFMRVIQLLTKLQESTSFFLRPQTFFGNIFEKAFVSRRREQMSVVNAIQEQTKFMRTGRLDQERTLMERIFEPQAIGRAFLSMATGFGIGRGKAEIADEKKARGEQLGVLERMSASLYQDITFRDQQEMRVQSRDEKLIYTIIEKNDAIIGTLVEKNDAIIKTIEEQTNALAFSVIMLVNKSGSRLSEMSDKLGDRIESIFSGGILTIPKESIASSKPQEPYIPMDPQNYGSIYEHEKDKTEKVDREKTLIDVMKEQYGILREELPKLTDQMKALIGASRAGSNKGMAGGVLGGLMGSLFGTGGKGGAPGKRGLFGKLFAPMTAFFGGKMAKTGGVKGILGSLWGGTKAVGKRLKAPGPIGALLAAAGLIGATQNNAQDNLQLGGSIAGGLGGAKLGAMAGSVVPGVGTVIGGVIGGTVGFVAGEQFGEFLGGLFKRKEKKAGEKADGIIDGVYQTLDEDIDDQSKTGAGRFVKKVFAVGSSVMSDIWSKSKEIAGPFLSSAWETTKESSATAWDWVKDTTKTFATGGAKTMANLLVDSVADVSGIIGSTIFKGIKWSIFEGLPALGSLFWEYSKWSMKTLLPAMFGVGKDLIKGLFDFGVTILGRALSWLGDTALSIFGWIGDKARQGFVSLGILESEEAKEFNKNPTFMGNPIQSLGDSRNPSIGDVLSSIEQTNQFRSSGNGVSNTNEVGSADYTQQMVNWEESEHRRAVEDSESEFNNLLKGSVEIEGTIATTLSKANELQQEAIRATRDLARAMQQQQQIPAGIARPEVDPSTLWTTLGFNE